MGEAQASPVFAGGSPAPPISVAAAVIYDDHGRFLLAQRPAGKVYAGYWEFPGGKVDAGETAHDALCRELHEELGIEVTRAHPWITRYYKYEHAHVKLNFFRVTGWRGELHGKEGQAFAWQSIDKIDVDPMLPANAPVLRALALPKLYGITHAADVGAERFLARLPLVLDAGLRLVQVREPSWPEAEREGFAQRVVQLAHQHDARVLINGDAALAARSGADGVHLRAQQLFELETRPDCRLVGASCHDRRELDRAAALGVDFVVLGPVAATPTHASATPLGWQRFGDLIADYALPVYALGGLTPAHLPQALDAGAHGVAMLRAAWDEAFFSARH
jgi:8-oxo-dGTP diphosphatase